MINPVDINIFHIDYVDREDNLNLSIIKKINEDLYYKFKEYYCNNTHIVRMVGNGIKGIDFMEFLGRKCDFNITIRPHESYNTPYYIEGPIFIRNNEYEIDIIYRNRYRNKQIVHSYFNNINLTAIQMCFGLIELEKWSLE